MLKDPIIDEVRKARDEYAKQFNYDLDAICRDLEKKQNQPGKHVVSFPPKRPIRLENQPNCRQSNIDRLS